MTSEVGAMRMEVMEQRELKKKTKLQVFNAMVLPTLLYGCETFRQCKEACKWVQLTYTVGCGLPNA